MIPKICDFKYVDNYRIWLAFEDGSQGEIDLADELWGEMFEPLKKLDMFKSAYLDKELNTIVWKNGADFAPEFLYEKIQNSMNSSLS